MELRLLFLHKSIKTMEVLIESPISLTESAVNEIRNIISEKQIPADYGLRVGVKGGGCSGMSYILGFDLQKENDNVYQVGDIQIIMEKSHGMYLAGMEIDFVDGLNNRGFSFNNPNATKTCGCGTSFEA
ncbi:MAG: iron-sulfur cluster assembly accessory protein [Chitinophagales bacterium]|jgi:iron-sulfur cluster assembly protein